MQDLKTRISEDAKVPARFLLVLCEDKVAADTHRLADLGDAEVRIQVKCKKPTELLSMVREWCLRDSAIRDHFLRGAPSAVASSDLPLLEYIIARDADAKLVNEKHEVWPPQPEHPFDIHRNCTVLHYAAILRDADLCKLILDHPGFLRANNGCKPPHRYYKEGWTALHIACDMGLKDICMLLLQHPQFTAVWDRDTRHRPALHYAIRKGHPEVVSAFLGHFQDDLKSYHCALDQAIESYELCQCMYYMAENSCDMREMLVQRCAESMSFLSPVAMAFLMQPENRKMLQHALKHCCRLLAGVHLGNGHLELPMLNRFDLSAKDELAHHRDVKLHGRRRRFLETSTPHNRMWRSKASRMGITSKQAVSAGLEDVRSI